MDITSASDGGGDDGTSGGGDDDGTRGGTSDGGGDDGTSDGGDDDSTVLVLRSGLARPPPWRAPLAQHRRPSVGRPHSELVGAARHMIGRSRLQLLPAPAPLEPRSSLQGRRLRPRGLLFSCP